MIKPKVLLLIFLILYFLIVGKLFYLQVIHPQGTGLNNYLQMRKIYPQRGKIFDRNNQPLVINKRTYLLYIEPKKIENIADTVKQIDSILQIGEATLEAKIDRSHDWVAIKGSIDLDTKTRLEHLNLSGVGFDDQSARMYPEASQEAHLLGFVGKNQEGNDIGYFGVEGFYDKDLSGFLGVFKSERDLLGKPIIAGVQQLLDPQNGRDLYLTIDKSVQEIVKRKLKAGLESYKAKEGCIIMADPPTMQILALVCLPDFDLEHYYSFSEKDFKNPAISNLYEPGSIFKPLVMAAALEEKKIKPDDFYDETGPIKVGEYTIQTWNNKYEGKISMTSILEKSSNVGMVHVGEKLGNDKLYQYLKKFGLGQVSGVDLQGEVGGYLKPQNTWYPIDFATVTFGQGIAVTPLQIIRAFNSLINGGKLLTPYVVDKIGPLGKQKNNEAKIESRPISPITSQIIVKMLTSTVENGEIHWAKPAGYSIGGKTGTAQVPIGGHYDPSKTIASFIGFAPTNNPKFIMLVTLREPKTSPWGSETAAPLFFDIAKELLIYYNIAPI